MKKGWDEEAAFHRMQKLAMDNNQKLVEIARVIITAEQASSPPGKQ
jgi:AmiR/NasT family two-component response regulator